MVDILVTGGSGFLGTNLIKRLEADNHEVINYDVRENIGFDLKYLPRLKLFVKNHAEIVYHLAAIPMHRLSMGDPWDVVHNNYVSTLNVAESCRLGDCGKIVFASSFAVYNSQPVPWTEDTPLEPTTPYGMCKIQSECLLKRYGEWYGIDVTIVRPSNVFGEYEELHQPLQVIPKWLYNYQNNRPLVVNGSKTNRDFSYVGDVVDGIIKASECSHPKVFNLCSGKPVLLKAVAERISDKIEVVDLPDYEARDWYGSYKKANKHLGFKPTKTIWEWINERKKTIESEKDNA